MKNGNKKELGRHKKYYEDHEDEINEKGRTKRKENEKEKEKEKIGD